MKSLAIKDFHAYPRNRFIDAQTSAGAKLAPTFLLTHQMGINGEIHEELTSARWAKVEFELPSASVKSAELLFYVNADRTTQEQPLRLLVNGHRIDHRQQLERLLTGGWDRCSIPARCLRQGLNEIIFADHGVLYVDPFPGGLEKVPESHSRRSFDGGQTWHAGTHGPSCEVAGEYLVHLRVKGYAPTGLLSSPVIDLADPDGVGRIAPRLPIQGLDLVPQQQTPEGTDIRFELRTGATPAFTPQAWTPWIPGAHLSQPGRFVQWRAILSTASADQTPVLHSVTLNAGLEEDAAGLEEVERVAIEQPAIARSSYPFTYLAPGPRQERLRKQYRLDEVIAAGRTELEQLALLRDWVHSQWLGWQSDKYPYCPPWDPLEILEVTKANWGFGMCTHYGAVFAGCAAALGFVSRSLVVDHHCLAEVWSEELQKWILQDAGPAREYDATYELDGVPLNALELHELLARGEEGKVMANKLPQGKAEPMSSHVGTFVRFGIPLRNDHLENPEPAELRHGCRQYHWNGYLWWSDALDPQYPEYSLQSTRPADFYWSVNQTRLYLQAGSDPGSLEVAFEHTTPNFAHFLVQRDGGDWEVVEASSLSWRLHPGDNELAVRSVNRFGRQGRISRAQVRCAE